MSALDLLIFLGAVALVFTGYYLSIRRIFELPLTGIELHPIYTPDGWRIMLYRHRQGDSNGEPVLLCHGFSSNHWNLNAPRGESVADYLAAQGFDCWTIDLRGTRSSTPPAGTPRHRATFDGYVMQDLPAAIAHIRSITGHEQVHWVGHSLGGTLLYAYELAHGRAHIASGTTIASPPGLNPFWPEWQSKLVWLLERLPGPFSVVQRALAPIHAVVKPRTRMVPVDWENLNPRFGVAEFFSAVETPPGPVTRTLEECARHRYLAVDNDRVNVLAGLNRLETPLLVFGCPLDPIVPIARVREFFERLPARDKRCVELSRAAGCSRDYDHIDPPFARNGATEVFAPIAEWIAAHPAQRGISASTDAETAPKPLPIEREAIPVAADTDAIPIVENARSSTVAPWGRALRDAAHILGGLDESGVPESGVDSVPRTARRAAKSKVATKRRAAKTATAKPKTVSRRTSRAEKPDGEAESPTLEATRPKKSGKKREKSKDKPRKKKSKSNRSKKK